LVAEPSPSSITVVLPTYNRAYALRRNLGSLLALEDVQEIVVVNDGSTDETDAVCAEITDPRLKLVSYAANRGVAAARNIGVDAAAGAWILFGEDDCRFPSDYATVLLAEAVRLGADIVGAPLLHLASTDEGSAAFAASAPRRSVPPTMDDTDVFPAAPMCTPFLPARALVRHEVFDEVRFYEGFTSNGYREETDFFTQAARSGFVCFLTGATYCYQLDTWDGGQHHSSPLSYEYWAARNNWTFLRRHGVWLKEQGHIRGLYRAQIGFMIQRLVKVAKGVLRARLGRLRARIGRKGQAT
jgi:glycosyltransferase involved in cell wall biosynthesis